MRKILLTFCLGLLFFDVFAVDQSGTVTFYGSSSSWTPTNDNASVTFTYPTISKNGSSGKICNVSSKYGIKGKNTTILQITCPTGYYFKNVTMYVASFGNTETPTCVISSGETTLYSPGAQTYTKLDQASCGTSVTLEDEYDTFESSKFSTLTVAETGNSKNLCVTKMTYTIAQNAACTSHTVTAATNNASYGTAAAASTTVCEGSTTTVTATPKSGYSFVSWAVSGTGSSLSSTSTNPTTLTMGTANATVTATFGCATPSAPSALVASSTTSSGTTLTITDATNTNNYDIYYSTSSTAPEAGTSATTTSTSKTKALTGLSASTTYYVWVRSVCDSTHKSSWTALTGSTFTTDAACTDPDLTITLN